MTTTTATPSRLLHRLAVAAACAALALPAFAQTTAPTATTPSAESAVQAPKAQRMTPADREARRAQWKEKHSTYRAERMTQLKQKLALTPAQEGAWTTFTQDMQQPKNDSARTEREDMRKLSTPERIDRMEVLHAQRGAAMQARGDATKAFYAQLQPAQQKTFDDATAHMGPKGQRGHKRHGAKGHHKGHGGNAGHMHRNAPSTTNAEAANPAG